MRFVLGIAVLLLHQLLAGCVMSTKPAGDTGFDTKATLRAFAGCFANVGEGGDGGASTRLSGIIWPGTVVDHKDVDVVRVDAEGTDVLHVSAIAAGHVTHESRFVEGRDFTLVDGQIKLKSHVVGSTGTEPGNPAIGVGSEAITLGLDKVGNGREIYSANFVGTAFLVFPVAMHGTDAVRFKRLSTCNGS